MPKLFFSLFLACIAVVTTTSFLVFKQVPDVAAQGSGDSLGGYAWSDTIGWVSLSGGNYGMAVDSDGDLSGYAWSDNIGWISANTSDLSGCPSSPCSAYIDSDGNLKGWLKAIAGGAAGWDGFISLSGSNYGPALDSDGDFSGYAWGDTVVGWLDFSYASTDYSIEPTAELKVRLIGEEDWQDSLTIQPTEEIELGWNQDGVGNTDSCQVVPPANNFSTEGAASGVDSEVDEPVGDTSQNYSIICYSEDDSQVQDTVTVTTVGGEGASLDCTHPRYKNGRVRRGTEVEICWELGTNNPAMCSIKAGAVDVLSPVGATSGTVSYPVYGEVTFSLECTGGDSDSFDVRVLPEFQET